MIFYEWYFFIGFSVMLMLSPFIAMHIQKDTPTAAILMAGLLIMIVWPMYFITRKN